MNPDKAVIFKGGLRETYGGGSESAALKLFLITAWF